MNNYVKILQALILFSLFVLVRAFESQLFYDPLLEYFKNDYLYKPIYDMDVTRLSLNMLFRYTLNSVISLGLIWVLFKRLDYLKFSIYFLTLAFTFLIIVFLLLLRDNFESGYLLLFYIRRFIIHPLFLLLLLPAFYYQKISND